MDWEDIILAQGCFVSLVLAIGWALAGSMRRKELFRQLKGSKSADSGQLLQPSPVQLSQHSTSLPGVTLIMPVKGCRPHSMSNWSSLLKLQYGGQLEYLFVLDAQDDPAWPALQQLKTQHPLLHVDILVAGQSTTCSQKIHNLIAGIRGSSPASQFVLLLDDDVELHPSCLHQLLTAMQDDPTLFMATGYPFDIPAPGANLATYCVLVYHLPLIIAFSVKQRTSFVWGGCMMLRRDQLLPHDHHQVIQTWADGGYSDDLLLAALCGRRGLPITAPSFAVFPQWLDGSTTWSQYINYLHRQLYVLDTYSDAHNKQLNHIMMAVHSWASAAWAASVCVGVKDLCSALLHVASTHHISQTATAPGTHTAAGISASLRHSTWLLAFLTCVLLAQVSLAWMSAQVLKLMVVLNPARKLSPQPWTHFNYAKLWAGMLIESLVLPCVVVYTLSSPYVSWAGVRYRKHRGRVRRVLGGSTTGMKQS